jgi:hypothetical protein
MMTVMVYGVWRTGAVKLASLDDFVTPEALCTKPLIDAANGKLDDEPVKVFIAYAAATSAIAVVTLFLTALFILATTTILNVTQRRTVDHPFASVQQRYLHMMLSSE